MASLGGTRRFAEFLPDSESMAERIHSPLAGLLVLTIASAFGALLAWSAMAEVEQVVQASGKIEPAGRVKVVNHPDGGRIADVHVVEGQAVAPGDPLVTFDGEVARTELADLLGRWQLRSAQAARLRAEADGAAPAFDAGLEQTRPDLIAAQTALLEERRLAHASQREALDQTVERRVAEVKSLAADQARLRDSHRLLKEQIEAARQLAEKGLYPRMKLVDIERLVSNIVGEIAEGQERGNAAEAALAEAGSRRDALDREWRSSVLTELAAVTAERHRLTEALKRHRAMMRNLVVRAPVEGIVQDLAVTGGGSPSAQTSR